MSVITAQHLQTLRAMRVRALGEAEREERLHNVARAQHFTACVEALTFAIARLQAPGPGEKEPALQAIEVAAPARGEAWRETIAQFLHDEVDLPDKIVGAQWPLHDNDDGFRGDRAYVRLQPKDIVEHYREAAGRLEALMRRLAPAPPEALGGKS